MRRMQSIKSCDTKFFILTTLIFVFYDLLGLVLVVAMAAMIMSVSRSQNRVRRVCEAWTVISSSILALSSPFFLALYVFMEVFSR